MHLAEINQWVEKNINEGLEEMQKERGSLSAGRSLRSRSRIVIA